MKRTIRVTFDGKVFRPEEPVELDNNGIYVIIIEQEMSDADDNRGGLTERPGADNIAVTDTGADYQPGVLDGIFALAQIDDLPEDYVAQLDHYLYGHPKR